MVPKRHQQAIAELSPIDGEVRLAISCHDSVVLGLHDGDDMAFVVDVPVEVYPVERVEVIE